MAVPPPDWSAVPEQCDLQLEHSAGVFDGCDLSRIDVGRRRCYVLGTGQDCCVRLPTVNGMDQGVAKEHALLAHHRNGLAYLVDLGSSFGTILDGTHLKPHVPARLKSGCSIVLGNAPPLLLRGGELASNKELLRQSLANEENEEADVGVDRLRRPRARSPELLGNKNSELPLASKKRGASCLHQDETSEHPRPEQIEFPPVKRRRLPAGARVFFTDDVDEIEPDSGISGE